jgi:hypothetical protein
MIVRVVAALSLMAGLVASVFYLHILGKSPTSSEAARHMRDMKDRTEMPATMAPVTFAEMDSLPAQLGVAEYSGIERRAVTLEGYVQRVVRAADGDFHLEIVPEARMPADRSLPYVTGEITPQWHRNSTAWSYPRLVELFRPTRGGVTAWERGTRRVRISGWLLYDYESVGSSPYAPRRTTMWEIHPVTRIEAWDDSLGRFVEHRR